LTGRIILAAVADKPEIGSRIGSAQGGWNSPGGKFMQSVSSTSDNTQIKASYRNLFLANRHFELYCNLRKAFEEGSEYSSARTQSPGFWDMTMDAHLSTAYQALSRAYDSTGGSCSIKAAIQSISNAELAQESTAKLVQLEAGSTKLREVRNKEISHTDYCVAKNGGLESDEWLSVEDFTRLVKSGIEILSEFSEANGQGLLQIELPVDKRNDFRFVLDATNAPQEKL
jgi:AbiU2